MIGSGTKFYRSDDGVAFTRIANILELTPPEEARGSSEKSFLDNDTNYKEFEPGMIDPGEMSITLEFNSKDSGQAALKADKGTKANFHYKIEYPDGAFDVFKAHVTGWGKAVPKEETVQRTVKFKVSGVITETAAA